MAVNLLRGCKSEYGLFSELFKKRLIHYLIQT